MSNSLAIAAVSESLRSLLDGWVNADPNEDPNSDAELAGTTVTVRPLDRARINQSGRQLNIFLYMTGINAAWRNQELPRQVRPGEAGRPPLPLNLYYLITAYGPEEDEIVAHRLLGRAMSFLHDHPVLSADLVESLLTGSDLSPQGPVRLTPQPLSLEEISKLWSAFQTQYRISAAYQAEVVLIESTVPARSPLPVLKRGPDDRGPAAVADTLPVLSSLYATWELPIQPPPATGSPTRAMRPLFDSPVVRLGETLTLRGQSLSPDGTRVRIHHPLWSDPIELTPTSGDQPRDLQVTLPAPDPAVNPGVLQAWPCGVYSVQVVSSRSGFSLASNELPFSLAPQISLNPLTAPHGALSLRVTCRPRLRAEQERRVLLLFGSRPVRPTAIDTPNALPGDADLPTTLDFDLELAPEDAGVYTCRLRVDGVDSLPFVIAAPTNTLAFDPSQQVSIT